MLGQRDDVAEIMMACDLMLLPSKIEGMPIVLIEAQCTGLKCIASKAVSHQVNIGKCSFIKLDINSWQKEILYQLEVNTDRAEAWVKVENAGYSDKLTASIMSHFYRRCIKNK